MKEYDISLLFFNNSIFSDIKKIGHIPVSKKWQGESCVEVFYDTTAIDSPSLSFLIETFLQKSLTTSLLKLPGRKALHIGVFFDTANCNFDLKLPVLSQLQQYNLEIVLSCYPHC